MIELTKEQYEKIDAARVRRGWMHRFVALAIIAILFLPWNHVAKATANLFENSILFSPFVWIIIGCIAIAFLYKKLKGYEPKKNTGTIFSQDSNSGIVKVTFIWVVDLVVRIALCWWANELIEYMITTFIAYNKFTAYLWIALGTGVQLYITYLMIIAYVDSIDTATIGSEDVGQLMFAKNKPIPFASNLEPYPIPLLPWFSLKSLPGNPIPIPVTQRTDNQGRDDALQIQIEKKKGDGVLVPHYVEVIFYTRVVNTYKALTKPLAPAGQGDILVAVISAPLNSSSFEELKTKDGKVLKGIVKDSIAEVNSLLEKHGLAVDRLQITDPVDTQETIDALAKELRDKLNSEATRARARQAVADDKKGTLTIEKAMEEELIMDGLLKGSINRVQGPVQSQPQPQPETGRGSRKDKRKGGGGNAPVPPPSPAPNMSIIIDTHDHHS